MRWWVKGPRGSAYAAPALPAAALRSRVFPNATLSRSPPTQDAVLGRIDGRPYARGLAPARERASTPAGVPAAGRGGRLARLGRECRLRVRGARHRAARGP